MCYARRQRLSWARIKLSKYVIYTSIPWGTYQSWFCSSYFKELVVSLLQFKNSKEFSESLFVLLFNFQGASRYRSLRQLDYYITSFFPCQYFFETFLKFFWSFFKLFSKSPALSRVDLHYTFFHPRCQGIFYKKWRFMQKCKRLPIGEPFL